MRSRSPSLPTDSVTNSGPLPPPPLVLLLLPSSSPLVAPLPTSCTQHRAWWCRSSEVAWKSGKASPEDSQPTASAAGSAAAAAAVAAMAAVAGAAVLDLFEGSGTSATVTGKISRLAATPPRRLFRRCRRRILALAPAPLVKGFASASKGGARSEDGWCAETTARRSRTDDDDTSSAHRGSVGCRARTKRPTRVVCCFSLSSRRRMCRVLAKAVSPLDGPKCRCK